MGRTEEEEQLLCELRGLAVRQLIYCGDILGRIRNAYNVVEVCGI
jgi:hypothetical protein